jgi:hypothetical protein
MTALLVSTITARTDVEPGWIHIDAPFVMKSRMDTLRARWDAPRHQFRVPLTWGNCLALRTELGDDLTLDPSLVDWARKYRGPAKGLLDLREDHEREIHRPSGPGFDTMFKHQMSGVDLIMRSEALHRAIDDGMGARYLILDETGVGKGLPMNAPVLTPTGWTPAGFIQEGDLLVGRDGQPTKVEGVFRQPKQQTYRVTFSDGSSVITDGPHLWSVQTSNDQPDKWRTMSTEKLLPRLYSGSGRAVWRIPILSAPVEFAPQLDLPMDPYTLGVILGDGHLRNGVAEINTDREILAAIGVSEPLERPGCWYGSITMPTSLDGLEGVRSWEKFVPYQYLTAPSADRLAILQGLMDTDGIQSSPRHQSVLLMK